jgi:hypothetical protein
MESPFELATRQLGTRAHVVPAKHRNVALELAALILVSGRGLDPDNLHQLIQACPTNLRTFAQILVINLAKTKDRERTEILHWADVLLTMHAEDLRRQL